MVVRSFEDVRKTMIEYDRAHPRECPVDQRQAEREAEEQARKAHAEQEQNQRDNPGISGYGDGWQVLSKRGKQGRRGKSVRGRQGAKGDKGDDALEIVNWHIDAVGYRAGPFISNGKPGPALELRDLFLRFIEEVGQ